MVLYYIVDIVSLAVSLHEIVQKRLWKFGKLQATGHAHVHTAAAATAVTEWEDCVVIGNRNGFQSVILYHLYRNFMCILLHHVPLPNNSSILDDLYKRENLRGWPL
jgi:hypothetical protein